MRQAAPPRIVDGHVRHPQRVKRPP
jgi:hypothetical protein